MLEDTIAAIATPPGEGGIGIVRISGSEARVIAEKLFRPRRPGEWRPYGLHLGEIVSPEGSIVDEVLLAWMPSPHSFTREDVVEIHGHGGVVALRRILEMVLAEGARMAGPGEFTRRAFLNGRIDLAQAEAVLEVVRARTDVGLLAAAQQLGGRISARIKEFSRNILGIMAEIEASIDFPEEVQAPARDELQESLTGLQQEVERLLGTARQGRLLREGLRLVIGGRPNVGKSSLLNALLDEERALVTDIPGTTRDVLQEGMVIDGIPVQLVDTAGLRPTDNLVERLGVERARQALRQADIVLVVLDAAAGLEDGDRAIMDQTTDRPRLMVVNKIDLVTGQQLQEIEGKLGPETAVRVSAKTGEGLDGLRRRITELVWGGRVETGREELLISARHQAALERCRNFLQVARAGLAAGVPLDLLTVDLRGAWEALGEITGETAGEAVIDRIFNDFCVGK